MRQPVRAPVELAIGDPLPPHHEGDSLWGHRGLTLHEARHAHALHVPRNSLPRRVPLCQLQALSIANHRRGGVAPLRGVGAWPPCGILTLWLRVLHDSFVHFHEVIPEDIPEDILRMPDLLRATTYSAPSLHRPWS